MWAPVHGCAMALPVRTPRQCGVRQHGPKVSPMLKAIQQDSFLLWIYLQGGGAESVADYALARLAVGAKVGEGARLMTLVRQCQNWAAGTPGRGGRSTVELSQVAKVAAERKRLRKKAAEAAWVERRAALVARDEERRRGTARQQLERQLRQGSAHRQERQDHHNKSLIEAIA